MDSVITCAAVMTHSQAATSLLLGEPGQLRDGIAVLLESLADIEVVIKLDHKRAALAAAAHHQPTGALILSQMTPTELTAFTDTLRAVAPATRIVVLVEDETAYQAACTTCADAVLMTGMLAARLLTEIETLLTD